MQKKNFVSMLLGTVGGILFAIGMCMCLLPEWGVFTQGIIIGAVGAVVLLAMLIVRRKMEGKPAVRLSGQGGRVCTAWSDRRLGTRRWNVHGYDLEHDDSRHPGRNRRYYPFALPHSAG